MCNLWACTQFRELVPSLILFQIEELDILAVIHLSPSSLVLLFLCTCSEFSHCGGKGYSTLAEPRLPITESFKICKNHNRPLLLFT